MREPSTSPVSVHLRPEHHPVVTVGTNNVAVGTTVAMFGGCRLVFCSGVDARRWMLEALNELAGVVTLDERTDQASAAADLDDENAKRYGSLNEACAEEDDAA